MITVHFKTDTGAQYALDLPREEDDADEHKTITRAKGLVFACIGRVELFSDPQGGSASKVTEAWIVQTFAPVTLLRVTADE